MADRCLLAVFAHPDDVTFRPGGTLALLAQAGVGVQVLTPTRGEAGACGDPPLCAPEALAAWREQELRCACAALGIEPPRRLAYPDGGLADVNAAELTAQILTAIREAGAQALISFRPDGLSGHPDHIAIGRCAAEAFRQAEDVAALYTVAVPASVAQALEMRQVHAVPRRVRTGCGQAPGPDHPGSNGHLLRRVQRAGAGQVPGRTLWAGVR